jgi:hypothetical protein
MFNPLIFAIVNRADVRGLPYYKVLDCVSNKRWEKNTSCVKSFPKDIVEWQGTKRLGWQVASGR